MHVLQAHTGLRDRQEEGSSTMNEERRHDHRGPRQIRRHAFWNTSSSEMSPCEVAGCGLWWESEVHWVLVKDEVITPLEETAQEKRKKEYAAAYGTEADKERKGTWGDGKQATLYPSHDDPKPPYGYRGDPLTPEQMADSGLKEGQTWTDARPERPAVSESDAYGTTWESVINQLPRDEKRRVIWLVREMVRWNIPLPQAAAQIVAVAESQFGWDFGDLSYDPVRWDKALEKWIELGKRTG